MLFYSYTNRLWDGHFLRQFWLFLIRRISQPYREDPNKTRMMRNPRKPLERSTSTVRPRGVRERAVQGVSHNNGETGESPYPSEVTLVVLGAPKTGKSALVSQFLWDGFVSVYRPTVEEFNWVEYDLGLDQLLMLQVIDTSGSHDFLAMRHLYAKTGDAFLVVFAVDDSESFEEAKRIVEEIRERNEKKSPILLLANKTDTFETDNEWALLDKMARRFALEHRILYFSLTAKDSDKVDAAFTQVLERLRSDYRCAAETSFSPPPVMRKRRQSMPSTRAYSGIDPADVQRLRDKHKKPSCAIS